MEESECEAYINVYIDSNKKRATAFIVGQINRLYLTRFELWLRVEKGVTRLRLWKLDQGWSSAEDQVKNLKLFNFFIRSKTNDKTTIHSIVCHDMIIKSRKSTEKFNQNVKNFTGWHKVFQFIEKTA